MSGGARLERKTLERSVTLLKLLLVVGVILLSGASLGVSESQAKPYSQIVDNANEARFETFSGGTNGTSGTVRTKSDERRGEDYVVAGSGGIGAAAYKVEIPSGGFYTVCGSWPSRDNYNRATPIKIKTARGVETEFVDQRKNGGGWKRLGTYKMKAGEGYKILVSRNSDKKGTVVADAFKVVRAPDAKGIPCDPESAAKGEKVYEKGRDYLGTRYVLGNPDECLPGREMDCSCLTMAAYRDTGIDIPEDPEQQWEEGREIEKPRKGDLLFYKEDGSDREISHVGIYAGDGKILHASEHSGEVSIGEMRWPGDGYVGARRLV